MDIAQFITEDTLKGIVPISDNVNISTPLLQCILDAQEFYIKPVLCENLYNEISDQIINSTLSPDNTILLNILAPCLAYYSLSRFIPWNWAKVREMGIINQTGTTGSNISLSDMTYMKEDAEASAKMYEIRLIKFLNDNASTYPLYTNCSCSCETKSVKNRWFRYV